jgi:hypothetical protein
VDYNKNAVLAFAKQCAMEGYSLYFEPELSIGTPTYLSADECYMKLQPERSKKIMCVPRDGHKMGKRHLFNGVHKRGREDALGKLRKVNNSGIAKVPHKASRRARVQRGDMTLNTLTDSPNVEEAELHSEPTNQSPSFGREDAQLLGQEELFSLRSESTL